MDKVTCDDLGGDTIVSIISNETTVSPWQLIEDSGFISLVKSHIKKCTELSDAISSLTEYVNNNY